MVPVAQRGLLSLGISTIGSGAFTQVTRMVLVTVLTSATMAALAFEPKLGVETAFAVGAPTQSADAEW